MGLMIVRVVVDTAKASARAPGVDGGIGMVLQSICDLGTSMERMQASQRAPEPAIALGSGECDRRERDRDSSETARLGHG